MLPRMSDYESAKRGFNHDGETSFEREIVNGVKRLALRPRSLFLLLYSDIRADTRYVSKTAIMTALGELVREGKLVEKEYKGPMDGYRRSSKTQMAWDKSKTEATQ